MCDKNHAGLPKITFGFFSCFFSFAAKSLILLQVPSYLAANHRHTLCVLHSRCVPLSLLSLRVLCLTLVMLRGTKDTSQVASTGQRQCADGARGDCSCRQGERSAASRRGTWMQTPGQPLVTPFHFIGVAGIGSRHRNLQDAAPIPVN